MRKFKLALSLLFFILVLGYTLSFAALNGQALSLDFLLGTPVELPTALWLGCALLLGALLGLLGGLMSSARHRLQVRRLNKEIAELKKRLNKLP